MFYYDFFILVTLWELKYTKHDEVITMQNTFSRELALDSSLASTKMEGFEITEQTRQDCLRLLDGRVSVPELVREITARKSKKAE